jgi:hypothetical protein
LTDHSKRSRETTSSQTSAKTATGNQAMARESVSLFGGAAVATAFMLGCGPA